MLAGLLRPQAGLFLVADGRETPATTDVIKCVFGVAAALLLVLFRQQQQGGEEVNASVVCLEDEVLALSLRKRQQFSSADDGCFCWCGLL